MCMVVFQNVARIRECGNGKISVIAFTLRQATEEQQEFLTCQFLQAVKVPTFGNFREEPGAGNAGRTPVTLVAGFRHRAVAQREPEIDIRAITPQPGPPDVGGSLMPTLIPGVRDLLKCSVPKHLPLSFSTLSVQRLPAKVAGIFENLTARQQ